MTLCRIYNSHSRNLCYGKWCKNVTVKQYYSVYTTRKTSMFVVLLITLTIFILIICPSLDVYTTQRTVISLDSVISATVTPCRIVLYYCNTLTLSVVSMSHLYIQLDVILYLTVILMSQLLPICHSQIIKK